MALLEMIRRPADLKNIRPDRLPGLSREIRQKLMDTLPETGGHLDRSLEAVELAIALHSVFDSPKDKILWDTGAQSLPHKLLTGRAERLKTVRQPGGMSELPRRSESAHDAFGTGRPGAALSAGLGWACARDREGTGGDIVAVLNHDSLGNGIVFEALQNAGQIKTGLIVILNDNQMSLSRRVGQVGAFLTKVVTIGLVKRVEKRIEDFLTRIHFLGMRASAVARRVKVLLFPGMLFQEMGFSYLGPVDGHDLKELIPVLKNLKGAQGPVLLHVYTKEARDAQIEAGLHPETGERLPRTPSGPLSYVRVAVQTLARLAEEEPRLVVVTAAAPDSTGFNIFRRHFPGRAYDAGSSEQHAVTFAAGMACGGLKPVVLLHSTHLQRGFDQVVHDVALQKLPVVFCVDRAGLSAEEGPTHHGVFDLSYLRMIPHLTLIAPKDENELQHALKTAVNLSGGPVAIRYPKGPGWGVPLDSALKLLPIGKGETLREGRDVSIVAVGSMVLPALEAAELLGDRVSCRVINARFVKPIDPAWLAQAVKGTSFLLTVEENVVAGGFGTAVREALEGTGLPIWSHGVPDAFPGQGPTEFLRKSHGLTAEGIAHEVDRLRQGSPAPLSLSR